MKYRRGNVVVPRTRLAPLLPRRRPDKGQVRLFIAPAHLGRILSQDVNFVLLVLRTWGPIYKISYDSLMIIVR